MRLTFIAVLFLSWYYEGAEANTCKSTACKSLADTLHRTMDLSIDPCDDFYQFTCGQYINNSTSLGPQGIRSLRLEVRDKISEQIHTLLKSNSMVGLPPVFQKARDFYTSCLDTAALEKRGLGDMKTRLKNYGDWPVLNNRSDFKSFNWIKALEKLTDGGEANDLFVTADVDYKVTDVTKALIVLNRPTLGLDASVLKRGMKSKVIQAYYEAMVDIAVEFGAKREVAKKQLMESLNFEIELAKMFVPEKDTEDFTSRETLTVGALRKAIPNIDWMSLFNALLGGHVTVGESDLVEVHSPEFMKKLGHVIAKTPNIVLANYMMWQTVYSHASKLTAKVASIYDKLVTVQYGPSAPETRQDYCMYEVKYMYKRSIIPIVGAAYVRKYVSDKTVKGRATKVCELLRKQLLNVLKEVDWLDEETRRQALKKVNNIKFDVAYPHELMDDKYLNSYFKDLAIGKSDFLSNVLSINKFQRAKLSSKLHKPFNTRSWEKTQLFALIFPNSGYLSEANAIDVYSGILTDIYFESARPLYQNLATLGGVVGHELVHSVDKLGAQYDEIGDLRNWWTNKTWDTFQRKAKAVADEYATYVVKETNQKLNAYHMVNEIIADQGGYKLARLAFEKELSGVPEAPKLIGLEKYTARQIFWLGISLNWCTVYSQAAIRSVSNSNHPPAEYRVNGPFRNSPYFALDWNCPADSYMNPGTKYSVW